MNHRFTWVPTHDWVAYQPNLVNLQPELLPKAEVLVWVARWLPGSGNNGGYEVVQDELFGHLRFRKDVVQHGETLYWQSIDGTGKPLAPPVPESLPDHLREKYIADERFPQARLSGKLTREAWVRVEEVRDRYMELLGDGYTRESAWEVVDEECSSEVAALIYLATDRDYNKRELWGAGYYQE